MRAIITFVTFLALALPAVAQPMPHPAQLVIA
jgi:hypothetical protein